MADYLFETSRYGEQGLWVKRILLCVLLGGIALLLAFANSNDAPWRFAAPIGVVVLIVCVPFDEISLTATHLVHCRRSVIPLFTRERKYQLAALTSVELQGGYNATKETMQTFTLYNYRQDMNSLQINYKNEKVRSFNTSIFRSDLLPIVKKANEIIHAGIDVQRHPMT